MQAIAISNGYMPNKVYVTWGIPHDKISGYEVYRDNQIIATSLGEEKETFVSPTLFDTDHQTNLFKKDSTFKLMYVDENVQKFRSYEYKIVAKRLDENNNVVEELVSNTVTIEVQ